MIFDRIEEVPGFIEFAPLKQVARFRCGWICLLRSKSATPIMQEVPWFCWVCATNEVAQNRLAQCRKSACATTFSLL